MKVKFKPGPAFDISTGTKSIRVDETTSAEDLVEAHVLLGEDERFIVSKTAKELAEETKPTNE